MVKISIIAAINNQSMIGILEYDTYGLAWPTLYQDSKYFQDVTTTVSDTSASNANSKLVNAIIVGRNTWTTLSDVYKKNTRRINFVVCTDPQAHESVYGEIYVASLDNAMKLISTNIGIESTYIIGGANIYASALKYHIDELLITNIESDYPTNNFVQKYIYFPLRQSELDSLVCDGILDKKIIEKSHNRLHNISMSFNTYSVKKYKEFNDYNNNKQHILYCDYPVENYKQLDNPEQLYLDTIKKILETGTKRLARNDFCYTLFGLYLTFDLTTQFPLLTIRKIPIKGVFEELMWIIRGQTDNKILQKKGVHIWDKNSSAKFLASRKLDYEEGDIGPGYGFQMRHSGAKYSDCNADYTNQGVDQLANCIDQLINDPSSRRIIIDLWNPSAIDAMALPPCHIIYNFDVELYSEPINGKRGKLNCHLFQRSWDICVGWNSTTAAFLTLLLANYCDYDVGTLAHSISNYHLYSTHVDLGIIKEICERKPRSPPNVYIRNKKNRIEDYEYTDITIENYFPCPSIKINMIE
jgi:thymidylate synthase